MSFEDITGISSTELCWSRTGAGFTSGGNGTDISAWADDTGNGHNATLADGPSAPSHQDAPPGGLVGPVAEFNGENGFATGLNLTGQANWWVALAWRTGASLAGFQNAFSSQGGAAEGSLYCNAGTLTYQEASTEATATTLSTNTLYILIFVATATGYELFVDNVSVDTFTSIGTPSDQPSALEFHAYGGTDAPINGHTSAYAVGIGTLSAGERTTLYNALLEEALGVADQDIDLETIASGHVVHDLASVTSGSDQDVDLTTIASAHVVHDLASVAVQTELDIDLATIASGHVVHDLASVAIPGALHDAFEGTGALDGYLTVNAAALPDVTEAGGRYLAELDDNTADVTLWFHGDAGRGDFKATEFPFEVIVRNIGIGVSAGDTQSTPTLSGNPYNFAGVQVNVDPTNPEQDYRHFVVGYRGATGFGGSERTVEAKTNTAGSSSVNDVGTNALTGTRADLRIVGSAGKSISFQWQEPNQAGPGGQPDPAQDSWSSAHAFPGSEPSWPDTVYVGLVTYAFGVDGVPFVGTADAIEDILNAQVVDLEARPSGHVVYDLASVAIDNGEQDVDLTAIPSSHAVHELASVAAQAELDVDLAALPSAHVVHELASVAAQPEQDVELTAVASAHTVHDLASVAAQAEQDVELTTIPSGHQVHNLESVTTAQAIDLETRPSTLVVHDLASLAIQSALEVTLAAIASGHVVHDLASVAVLDIAAPVTITAYSRPATLIDIEEDPVPHTAGDRVETTIRFRVGGVLTAPDSWSVLVQPRRGPAFEVTSGDADIAEVQPGEYVWTQQTDAADPSHVGRWDYVVLSDGAVAPGARNGFFEVRRAAVVA